MYKLLIPDDEPFIPTDLPYVINWEQHGAEIAVSDRNRILPFIQPPIR